MLHRNDAASAAAGAWRRAVRCRGSTEGAGPLFCLDFRVRGRKMEGERERGKDLKTLRSSLADEEKEVKTQDFTSFSSLSKLYCTGLVVI